MILHANGSYDRADWHTEEFCAERYPNSHFIDESTEEGAALATKILSFPYFSIITDEEGNLSDVVERDPTPEEIEAQKPVKTPEQLRIEQLEAELADVQLALAELFTA
ncbi:hypothetical protein [Paenibacillus harenae]|uniref:hypothetical protein n=1 Tax=Paenibacillus harenae TaxID=306543 RepID=UPI000414DA20|nr:hypothetical protein [Paenibacillus harenae]